MDHQELLESHQQSLESMLMCPAKPQQESVAKKPRLQPEQALECPRCESTNTKFCYYNNYSLSQPRYFCKSCRRYWTKGGTLRNIPVGGGCRKSKRASSSSRRISIATIQHREHQHSHHQHSDSNVPLTALDNSAYEASNQGESFHLPLMFAPQLHHIFSDEEIDGYSFPTGEGFLEAPSMGNLQSLCFRLGDGAMGEAVHTNGGISGESMLPYEEMKLDHFSSGENGFLLGCQWPLMNVDGISNPGNLSSIGGSWNDTGFSSSLHNLVNSPLM